MVASVPLPKKLGPKVGQLIFSLGRPVKRSYRMLQNDPVLPYGCSITSMAEEYFRGTSEPLGALKANDELVSAKVPEQAVGGRGPDSGTEG